MRKNKQQLKELIKKKAPTAKVREAQEIEQRIRFHCDPKGSSDYESKHLRYLKGLQVSKEKIDSYKSAMKAPYVSTMITGDAFSKAGRVFETNDLKIEAREGAPKNDYPDLLTYYKSIVMNVLRVKPYSYIVVDKPSEPSENINPFYYTVNISDVLHVHEVYEEGKIIVKEILFWSHEDQSYFFVSESEWLIYDKEGALLNEVSHTLATCPVVNIWHEFVSFEALQCKNHIVYNVISELDMFMVLYYGRFIGSLVDFFPIFWRYEESKDVNAKIRNNTAKSNENRSGDDYDYYGREKEEKKLRGAGSEIIVPRPNKLTGNDMREPMGRIPSDSGLMKQTKEELEAKAMQILTSIISGNLASDISAELSGSVTATQIRAIVSSRADFFIRVKDNIEKSFNLLLNTLICVKADTKFKEYYKLDLGDDFFFLEESEAIKLLEAAKTVGLGHEETMNIYRQYLNSKHSKNQQELRKALIISYIEPYPYLSMQEAKTLSEEIFKNKVVINEFITKFEVSKQVEISDFMPEATPKMAAMKIMSDFVTQNNV